MSEMLKPGQVVFAEVGGRQKFECQVKSYIGDGGQGEVYRATLSGRDKALKWYNKHTATRKQRKIVTDIVRKSTPNKTFLWPEFLASAPGVENFGYIMPLLEERFWAIPAMLRREIKPEPSFWALTTAGFHLANSFAELHLSGMCYRDISINNIFIDPANGDIRIADNDNVAVDTPSAGALIGTPNFMAPEIVKEEAPPSTETDLYSLNVLLFHLFFLAHPLHGEMWWSKPPDTPESARYFYGENPVFIKDEEDDSNRPLEEHVDLYWQIYPEYILEHFKKTFTSGLHDPYSRAQTTMWRADLLRLRDTIIYCSHCDAENFYDESSPDRCWNCQQIYDKPPHLHIEHRGNEINVMLNRDSKLYPHHLAYPRKINVIDKPMARILQHKDRPDLWGLLNLSGDRWVMTRSDGRKVDVLPGHAATLRPGTLIKFGRIEGELRE